MEGKDDKIDDIYLYTCAMSDVESSQQKIIACAETYAKTLCIDLPETLVIRRKDGKPYFENAARILFSVSHSGTIWACAFGSMPIGLDIQQHGSCNMHGVSNRFFHPDEQAYLLANDYQGFFDVWVAKESYVKYTGRGIDDDFASFSVIRDGMLAKRMEDACFLHVHTLPNYSLCICSKNPMQCMDLMP